MIDTIPITEPAQIEKTNISMGESRMFGHNLAWWNEAMLISLGIAAICAIAVAFTTTVVVKLQRQAEINTEEAFNKYKIDSGKDIAQAAARAAEANEKAENERLLRVKLQQQLARRRLTGSQREQLKKILSKHPYNIGVVSTMLDLEGSDFADDFASALKDSNWHPVRIANHIGNKTGLYVGTVEGTELEGTKILAHALDVLQIPHKVISFKKGDSSIPSSFQSGVLYLVIETKPLFEPVK